MSNRRNPAAASLRKHKPKKVPNKKRKAALKKTSESILKELNQFFMVSGGPRWGR